MASTKRSSFLILEIILILFGIVAYRQVSATDLEEMQSEVLTLKESFESLKKNFQESIDTVREMTDGVVKQLEAIAPPAIAFTAILKHSAEYYHPVTADEVVPFKDVVMNIGGGYNGRSATFKCPVDGVYFFSFSINSGELKNEWNEKNYGSSLAGLMHSSGSKSIRVVGVDSANWNYLEGQAWAQGSASATVQCKKNDKVWVKPTRTESNQINKGDVSSFSGFLLYKL